MNVTVLIANYNYGEYISDAIRSAMKQTYGCNVVIVDDGSTDDSNARITESLSSLSGSVVTTVKPDYEITKYKYPPGWVMHIKLNKNGGPSRARNIAISETIKDTDFYQILDADDVMSYDKVQYLIQEMTDEVGVVYADYDIFDVESGLTRTEYKEPFSIERLLQECIIHSGSLIKSTALERVKNENGYYNQTMRCAEDYELWVRISRLYAVSHVPTPLTLVRNHRANSTFSVDNTVWKECWGKVQKTIQNLYG